jgi:DNA-binding beta-propeller fold protein YncE
MRRMPRRHRGPYVAALKRFRLIIAAALVLAVCGAAVAATTSGSGGIGPSLRITGNGRLLSPPGTLVTLGHFPTGGALTPDGRYYWTVSTGRALNDIRIVSVLHPKVVQILPLPGASGGIAIDPTQPVVYVSGLQDSNNTDEMRPGLPGRGGDVIHVFRYDRRSGRASETATIAVPPPASAPTPQAFPPTNQRRESWPDRLAVSPDGHTLLVPLNLADAAAVVDTASHAVRYVPTGPYPYGAAILPGSRTGLVSNEGSGTVSVINLATATKVKDIQVAPNLSHPEGIALNPRSARAYVAIANDDQVAVIDTNAMAVDKVLSVQRAQGGGESPVAVAVTPDGRRLAVAEAAADDVAIFTLPSGTLIGRVPTAAYPADVQTTGTRLLWIAGKGFGSGANPNGPNPYVASDNNLLQHPGTAVLSAGRAGILPFPSGRRLNGYTLVATRQVIPINFRTAPAGTPLRPGGPIKHVFYIVRENRTYDQVLGDDPRGDGDPDLTLFGKRITPNMHALVQRFPLLDHVYADSEASIDGHFWTSAAAVSDYVQKNWEQNYAGRNRPYDFGAYSISWPGTGFLFDQAERQHISYFNYGEAIAGVVPLSLIKATDKDASPAELALVTEKLAHSDIGFPLGCYPNDSSIGTDSISAAFHLAKETFDSSIPAGASQLTSESRFSCFRQRFLGELAAGSVPAFNYLVLPSDHTNGLTPGARSPRSMVAENDYGLGQVVDLISHSKIWGSSAIFVLEDDSQDGADHVDAHRMPGAVFSPYVKRGAVIHTRYDMLSFIRSMELIIGMRPLGLPDAVATPMYDVFQSTPSNGEPYNVIPPAYPLLERNPNTAANRDLTRGYNYMARDQVPQDIFDAVLWKAVHGVDSQPPPPGPNAVKGQ